ncbi:MAG TPA: hypothetical protein VF916_11350, partial [Ktedonobacterales bacterium]
LPAAASVAALGEPATHTASVPGPTQAATSLTAQAGTAMAQAAELITSCIAQGGMALIEHDVGSDGIEACLGPFLRWSVGTGRRVVIAAPDAPVAASVARTHIPRALARLGLSTSGASVAELVEPSAYLCLHRWFGAATLPRDSALPRELARGLSKLAIWSRTTLSGRRSDVALTGQELAAWDRARAGREFCDSSADCAYRKRGYCFVARAEAQAKSADVLVTTHAALAEALVEQDDLLLPLDRVLILDAQSLEEELRRAGSWTLERESLQALLADLAETAHNGARRGLLHLLAERDSQAPEASWFGQVARARAAVNALFVALGRLQGDVEPRETQGSKRGAEPTERAVRLDAQTRQRSSWHEVEAAWTALRARLTAVARLAGEVAVRYPLKEDKRPSIAADGVATDLLGAQRTIERLCASVALAFDPEPRGMVYWLRQPHLHGGPRSSVPSDAPADHASPRTEPPVLCAARVEIGGLFAPLAAQGHAVVLAGSALAVGGEFDYLCGTLGVPTAEACTQRAAPDRAGQTLLIVPDDMVEPNQPSYQRALDHALIALGASLNGRVVAIFPSHAALRAAYTGIKQTMEQHDVLVLAQGLDGSVRQLWQTYRSQPRVMLLGAGAFWDGSELDGPAPACV